MDAPVSAWLLESLWSQPVDIGLPVRDDAETIAKIKDRTKTAMLNPQVSHL